MVFWSSGIRVGKTSMNAGSMRAQRSQRNEGTVFFWNHQTDDRDEADCPVPAPVSIEPGTERSASSLSSASCLS